MIQEHQRGLQRLLRHSTVKFRRQQHTPRKTPATKKNRSDEEEQQEASSAPPAAPEDAIELTAAWMHHSTYFYEADQYEGMNSSQFNQERMKQSAKVQDEEMQEIVTVNAGGSQCPQLLNLKLQVA